MRQLTLVAVAANKLFLPKFHSELLPFCLTILYITLYYYDILRMYRKYPDLKYNHITLLQVYLVLFSLVLPLSTKRRYNRCTAR